MSVPQNPVEYWGKMIRPDRSAAELFTLLLRGIANYVIDHVHPREVNCLVPEKLAAFYKSVGGDYDALFLDTPFPSLSFLYQAMGCIHSLRQSPTNAFGPPSIPALSHSGFARWQTIQLLLDPNEQVPFLQEAVRKFDIVHPTTGEIFPKVLPREAFPENPDGEMTQWYTSVAEKLEREARAEQEGIHAEQPREHTRDTRQRQRRDFSPPHDPAAGTTEMPDEATYFRSPNDSFTPHDSFHGRNGSEKVVYVTPPVSPYQYGHLRNRRRSFPEEIYNQGSRHDTLHTHHHSARRRKSHSPMRRGSIESPSGSESDTESLTDAEPAAGPRTRRNNQLSPSPLQTRFVSPLSPPILAHRGSRDFPDFHERYGVGARGRGDYGYDPYHHPIPSQRDGYVLHQPGRGPYRGQSGNWSNADNAYPGGGGVSPDGSFGGEWIRGGGPGIRRIIPHTRGVDGRRFPSYY
ncbi:MAG: hypothetical protein M1839_007927 [Geoglossum umbratile]|nr:MAG: hypothetical protein M1839_007927 [Geoglossum umbratile]